ncbi:helix-turn-helix domain-containing protein [Sinomonas sp. RB5]
MDLKTRKGRTRAEHASSVHEWFEAADRGFAEEDLVAALDELTRDDSGVDLPSRDREFWEAHSGIAASERDRAAASAKNAAARLLSETSVFTAEEVAAWLRVSASTVRHYRAAQKLYSFLVRGRIAFPEWQFTAAGGQIPHLEAVLRALPEGLHPQAVEGFFLTPQPDLRLRDEAVSPKEWLESGGSAEAAVALASGLGSAY